MQRYFSLSPSLFNWPHDEWREREKLQGSRLKPTRDAKRMQGIILIRREREKITAYDDQRTLPCLFVSFFPDSAADVHQREWQDSHWHRHAT